MAEKNNAEMLDLRTAAKPPNPARRWQSRWRARSAEGLRAVRISDFELRPSAAALCLAAMLLAACQTTQPPLTSLPPWDKRYFSTPVCQPIARSPVRPATTPRGRSLMAGTTVYVELSR